MIYSSKTPKYFFLLLYYQKDYKNLHGKYDIIFHVIIYYILEKGVMQTMNLEKIFKNVLWIFTSSRFIENLPDAVILVNSAGLITRANKKARDCFNLTNNDINPAKIEDIIVNGQDTVKYSLRSQKPVLATAKNGEKEFYTELNASRYGSGLIIVLRDVTKLINETINDEKTTRFNGEKNAMLVKLEGDIKAPISSILGFSQGLLDGMGGELSEKQAKYVNIINSNSMDLYNFVDKLLEFSYAESSLYEAEYKNFDIVESIKNTVKSETQQFENKKIEVTFDYDSIDKRTIYIDSKAFNKAIKNILEVSIAMTENGKISLKLEYPDQEDAVSFGLAQNKGYMHLIIKDSGCGIDKSEMKYLCDPYAQLDNGKKHLARALKLGSACILIRRSGGYIDINSEPMQGTAFDIIIPVEKEEDE